VQEAQEESLALLPCDGERAHSRDIVVERLLLGSSSSMWAARRTVKTRADVAEDIRVTPELIGPDVASPMAFARPARGPQRGCAPHQSRHHRASR
jgi:hypothetical protein